jgi:2-dehydropantoate 2-reductase
MKIAVIGTGGVGGYFGGKLALAGHEVTFVARGKHLEAIKENGLRILSPQGDFLVKPVKATDDITSIGPVDLIIIGLKAWQVKESFPQLHGLIGEKTMILPLQNGVLVPEELKNEFKDAYVLGGLCRIFSEIEGPGVIRHVGVEPKIVFGALNNEKSEQILQLKEAFDQAGFQGKIADDIQVELWKKFIFICSGGLIALTRSNYGKLRALPATRELMKALLNEINAVAQKAGVQVKADYVENTFSFIDAFPAEATTSLARDIWEGKPSELEYQTGTVVKLGEKHGVETPVNRFVYSCLLPQELEARKSKD